MAFKEVKERGGKDADVDPKAEAVRLYSEGMPAYKVGKVLNVDGKTIAYWLRSSGVNVRGRAE